MRTKSAWLLAVPFLVLARPRPEALGVGATVSVLGLLLRGWSAGTIRKDEVLTTSGPYAFMRHPLYVGSFMIGVGMSVAGGHWIWPALVVAFFATIYRRTAVEERERLTGLFGPSYRDYLAEVPALVPRLSPYRPAALAEGGSSLEHAHASTFGFSWSRYVRHREWEALLGTAAALAVLALKVRTLG